MRYNLAEHLNGQNPDAIRAAISRFGLDDRFFVGEKREDPVLEPEKFEQARKDGDGLLPPASNRGTAMATVRDTNLALMRAAAEPRPDDNPELANARWQPDPSVAMTGLGVRMDQVDRVLERVVGRMNPADYSGLADLKDDMPAVQLPGDEAAYRMLGLGGLEAGRRAALRASVTASLNAPSMPNMDTIRDLLADEWRATNTGNAQAGTAPMRSEDYRK